LPQASQSSGTRARSKAHHEKIYLALRDDIVAQRVVGGEKLLEAELARRFNVSRTPIREALHRLERDGLITRKVNVGAIVAKNSEGDVAAGVGRLGELQEDMKAAYRDRNVERYENANRLFHAFFVEQSGNAHLREMVEATKRKMYDMAAESFPSAFHIEQYLVDHDRIVAAIERRDAAQAVAAMRAHLRNVGDNLLGAAQLAPSP
jgi:DNA-binding GntR family transcriptional regulator